jgi:hypothetical protein
VDTGNGHRRRRDVECGCGPPVEPDATVSLRTNLVRGDGGTTTDAQINAYRLR